jgi:hypothetical protein
MAIRARTHGGANEGIWQGCKPSFVPRNREGGYSMSVKGKAITGIGLVVVLFVLSLVLGYWVGAVFSGAAILLTIVYALSPNEGVVRRILDTDVLGDRGRDGKPRRPR